MAQTISIGRRGAITLPAKIRKRFGLEEDDQLLIEETEQGLLLRPAVSIPVELYTEKRIQEFAADDDAVSKVLDDMGVK
ncbi:MAG: AbrB/MazE/SpoVT family DNA-binding domain-containing protein [Verrucomicrobiota bacterium]